MSGRNARRRLRVGVIFGGRSVEHEVSLVSARAIMNALDPRRYEVVPIGITRQGRWICGRAPRAIPPDPSAHGLVPVRGAAPAGRAPRGTRHPATRGMRDLAATVKPGRLDVVFPMIHGTGGEDGALQGLLELADIPYVGAGVLGSAVGMDKASMKALFRDAGLPIVDFRVFRRADLKRDPLALARDVEQAFGYPCFVKPSNGGSSVGVSKARDARQLLAALHLASRYDRKVLVERAIDAREVECSVLGNEQPEASVVGEIIPAHEFYDYRAKYIDTGSRLEIPARITEEQARLVREYALRAFRVLDLAGMARADFFLDRTTHAVFINEVNTIPGFTPISMYPKLWEASGLPFSDLVDRLIRLALERHAQKKTLITRYAPGSNGERGSAAARATRSVSARATATGRATAGATGGARGARRSGGGRAHG